MTVNTLSFFRISGVYSFHRNECKNRYLEKKIRGRPTFVANPGNCCITGRSATQTTRNRTPVDLDAGALTPWGAIGVTLPLMVAPALSAKLKLNLTQLSANLAESIHANKSP